MCLKWRPLGGRHAFLMEGKKAPPSLPHKGKNGLPVLPPLANRSLRAGSTRIRIHGSCVAPSALSLGRANPLRFVPLPPSLPLLRANSEAGAGLLPLGQALDRFAEWKGLENVTRKHRLCAGPGDDDF